MLQISECLSSKTWHWRALRRKRLGYAWAVVCAAMVISVFAVEKAYIVYTTGDPSLPDSVHSSEAVHNSIVCGCGI